MITERLETNGLRFRVTERSIQSLACIDSLCRHMCVFGHRTASSSKTENRFQVNAAVDDESEYLEVLRSDHDDS